MKKTKQDKKKALELKLQRIRQLTPPDLANVAGGLGACDTSCRMSGCGGESCGGTCTGDSRD